MFLFSKFVTIYLISFLLVQCIDGVKIALEYGLDYIEKHFTIDQNLPGRDNKFSILPDDLNSLSNYIKIREK